MENAGNQSRHKDETYAEWMARLYPPISRESNLTGTSKEIDPDLLRPSWGFRPAVPLSWQAHKFMRENNMNITTFLNVVMHEWFNSQNSFSENNQKNG